MMFYCPRLVIAALRGGSGKTLISVGLCALLKEKGYRVAVFKKGPDFIDPGWLSFAAKEKCFNLDPFLIPKERLISSFLLNSANKDIAIVEGNRGIYDGMDLEGRYSTAELAKILDAPVLIILDVSMSTRTISAILKGCQVFDRDVKIKGVVLNKVAGKRQENLITSCIRHYCGIPVVGAIPKLKKNLLKERHMGLVPHQEREEAEKVVQWAKDIVANYTDIEEIIKIAKQASFLNATCVNEENKINKTTDKIVKIGYLLDKAFWFYYPENLDALRQAGAKLIRLNALEDKEIPELDAIYIGGGFPETQAEALANNELFRKRLKAMLEAGTPVYAECGGLMYLGKSLILDHNEYPMVDFFPISFFLEKKPQGHGYTMMEVCGKNPFFEQGKRIKGHEFHYSRAKILEEDKIEFAFKMLRGKGIFKGQDGVVKKNTLATYTHIHALGDSSWADSLVKSASHYSQSKHLSKTVA